MPIRGVGGRQLQKHRKETAASQWAGGIAQTLWRLFNLARDTVSIFIGGELRLGGGAGGRDHIDHIAD